MDAAADEWHLSVSGAATARVLPATAESTEEQLAGRRDGKASELLDNVGTLCF